MDCLVFSRKNRALHPVNCRPPLRAGSQATGCFLPIAILTGSARRQRAWRPASLTKSAEVSRYCSCINADAMRTNGVPESIASPTLLTLCSLPFPSAQALVDLLQTRIENCAPWSQSKCHAEPEAMGFTTILRYCNRHPILLSLALAACGIVGIDYWLDH